MSKGIKIAVQGCLEFLPLMIFWSNGGEYIFYSMISCIFLILYGFLNKRKSFMLNGIFIMLIIFYIIDLIGINVDRMMLSYLLLGLICTISVLVNRPYTMYLSRSEYNEISDTPLFIEMNIILSNIFAGVYYACFLICLSAIPMKGLLISIFIVSGILSTFILPRMMPGT